MGDGKTAIKSIVISKENYMNPKNKFISYLNHEIGGMMAFDDLNIVKVMPNGCYLEKLPDESLLVELKLFQYMNGLDKMIKGRDYRNNTIWKADIIFKLVSAIKKLHDNKVCHLDLKE